MDESAPTPIRTVLPRGCPPTQPPGRSGPIWPEWTLSNGLGGFAMGTALGVNTRRYHGLLVAAINPPVERAMILSQVADVIRLAPSNGKNLAKGEAPIELRCTPFHFLTDHSVPIDHPSLLSFEHDGVGDSFQSGGVRWVYRFETPAGEVRVVKSLTLADSVNSCTVRYDIESPRAWTLELRPLVAMRDTHKLRPSDAAESHVNHRELKSPEGRPGVLVSSRDLGAYFSTDGGRYESSPQRWKGFEYLWERIRGLDSNESVFSPGRFIASAERSGSVSLHASVHAEQPRSSVARTRPVRVRSLVDHVLGSCPSAQGEDRDRLIRLAAATDLFVVQRGGGGCSVIAGYPWFTDWGRDTMISMPGLLLCTGRFEEAGRTLVTFARARRRGLIPNHFDDVGGAAHFNTVDASLWFINACGEYLNATGDREVFNAELLPACEEIIESYTAGTDFSIGTDRQDGLIVAGDINTQLTWMDARRDGVTFTPRFGKPVEINALWHHALLTLAQAVEDPEQADELQHRARRVASSFHSVFCGGPLGGLFDRAQPTGAGWSKPQEVRPNQILAASLAHGPLDDQALKGVVAAVGEHLLSDAGLRTLAPGDEGYCPRFEGDLFERDGAYHNGTVWPWLIGAYAEAVLRAGRFSAESRETARQSLRPVIDRMGTDAIGSIPEVYDADAPRRPDGCMAQAWSVAEPLRALMLTYRE